MSTVRDLIEMLSKHPQDEDVHIRDQGTDHDLVLYRFVYDKAYTTIEARK